MISVCLASYNGEKYIKEQIDSILPQLQENDELVISDDNSTDATLNIIKNYNDKRIKLFNNKSQGVLSNFENAISNSSGEYIFLADQDDIWMDNKISACKESFDNGYDLIISDCKIFDSETNQIVEESFFLANNSKKGIIHNILRNNYIGCCMAFNSSVKLKVLPFPKSIPMHDSWIGILSEIYFKVNFDNRKLINYRKHKGNVSFTSSGKSKYSIKKKISFRYFLIINIIRRLFLNI